MLHGPHGRFSLRATWAHACVTTEELSATEEDLWDALPEPFRAILNEANDMIDSRAGVPPTVGLDICMGLDAQCCIFGELIVCVRTVQVPTGYKYGNVSWDVPCMVQPCVMETSN